MQKDSVLQPLKIGNVEATYPIIQGGMAVQVSMHSLAGNVAKCGGIGIIAGSCIYDGNIIKEEIKKAKEIAQGNGLIGLNIMGVMNHFTEIVTAALEGGIDLIIQGAGFRPDVFEMGKKFNVPIVAISSSVKVSKKAEDMGAAAVVIEGCEAGGHLGFKPEHPFVKTEDIIPGVVEAIDIPVIAAGGVYTGTDIANMIEMGAAGVQMGTRFVATHECTVHDNFKQTYLNAKEEDVIIIKSPVGLPGRAVKSIFTENLNKGIVPEIDYSICKGCMGKYCGKQYCIVKALEDAKDGDLETGLYFAGSNVYRVNEIVHVADLMDELISEANEALSKEKVAV